MDLKKKVIIDCDPGVDDSFALLLCIRFLDVKGIVAVGGNAGLDNTQRNARYITELTKRTDIPVYAGYALPMLNKVERATSIHGKGGLGSLEIEEPKKQLEKQHGVDYLIDTFMNHDDISLITLGPLTNVAQAILKEPKIKDRIPEILIMGGSAMVGNATPTAEFNIYADPEAAKIVFESGIPIKMVGLNTTRQNPLGQEHADKMKEIGGPVAEFCSEILGFYAGVLGTATMPDAVTVGWWIDDSIITKSIKTHVTVETKGEYTRGMTVCDWRCYMGAEPSVDISRTNLGGFYGSETPNVDVAMEFDQKRFLDVLYDTLEWYKTI